MSTVDKQGRRRVLTVIGASALATAVATFGRSSPAFAGNYGCCNLAHPPGDPAFVTWARCTSPEQVRYVWYCSKSPSMDCGCCETHGNRNSSGRCYYV